MLIDYCFTIDLQSCFQKVKMMKRKQNKLTFDMHVYFSIIWNSEAEIDVTFEADKIILEQEDNVVAQSIKIAQKVTCWKQIKLPMTK